MFIKHSEIFSVIPRQDRLGRKGGMLRLRVLYNAVRSEISLGITIDIDRWDQTRQKMKGAEPDSHGIKPATLNTLMAEYIIIINGVFQKFEEEKTIPSPEQVRLAFWAAARKDVVDMTNKPSPDITKVMRLFMEDVGRKNAWANKTYSVFKTIERDILEFDPGMRVSDFTEKRLTDFVYFLQTSGHSKIRRKSDADPSFNGLRNTTVEKRIDHLKEFLKWAYDNKYSANREFMAFKPRFKTAKVKPIFLTKEELYKLCAFRIPEEHARLETVRDVFIFSCFTGLRYSDVQNLRHSNIKKDHIESTTIKTSDTLEININVISRRILDKYKDFDPYMALPTMSNQKMNVALKELARMAGLTDPVQETYFRGGKRFDVDYQKWERMSTHVARRTFVSNSFQLGIPPEVIKQWTGHSSYQAMKPYIAISSSIKADQMQKLNWEDLPVSSKQARAGA